MENIMGFDGYLYYVIAYDNDGTRSVYEYGNLKHAMAHFEQEKRATIISVKMPFPNVEVKQEIGASAPIVIDCYSTNL